MSAPADSGRSAGFLAMPRATIASSPVGSPGLRSLTFGGACETCAYVIITGSWCGKGCSPVSAWTSSPVSE